MATGICYTQSGTEKRYEDGVSISLVKGTHDLPTIKNDVLSVANENHYSFEVSSSYKLNSKSPYPEDNAPLIFVTYYPSSGKNPRYFNFAYNYIDIEILLEFVWPSYVKLYDKDISLSSNGGFIIYINGESKTITKKSDLKFKIVKGSSITIGTSWIKNLKLRMYMANNSNDVSNYTNNSQDVYNDTEKIILSDTNYTNITESTTIHIKFTNKVIYMIPLYDTNSDYNFWLNTRDARNTDNKYQCYTSDSKNDCYYTLATNNETYAYASILFHHVYKNHRIGAFMGTIVLPSLKIPTKLIDYNKVKNTYKGYAFKRNTNSGVLWGAAQQVKTTYQKNTFNNSNNETLNNDTVIKKDESVIYDWPNQFPYRFIGYNDLAQKIINNGYGGDGCGFTQYNQVKINGMFYDNNYSDTSINYRYRKVGTVHYVSRWKGNSTIICDSSVTSNKSFKQNMPYNGVLLGMKEWYNDTIVSAGNISFGGINAIYTGEYCSFYQEGKIGSNGHTFLQWIDPSNTDNNKYAGYFMIGRYYRKGYFLCSIGARFAVYPGICKDDVIAQWSSWDISNTFIPY